MNRTPERRQFMVETPPAWWLTAVGRLAAGLGWRDGAGRSVEVRDDPARRRKDELLGRRASGLEILRWNRTGSRSHYRDGGKAGAPATLQALLRWTRSESTNRERCFSTGAPRLLGRYEGKESVMT